MFGTAAPARRPPGAARRRHCGPYRGRCGCGVAGGGGRANLHLTPGSAIGSPPTPHCLRVVIAVCALVAAIRPLPSVSCSVTGPLWWGLRRGRLGAGGAVTRGYGRVVVFRGPPRHRPGGLGAHAAAVRLRGFRGGLAGDVRRAAAGAAIGHHGGLRLRERLIMAGCGSVDIMNWDAVMHLGFSSNPAAGCLAVASQPATWVVGASWVAAAGLYSLLCVRGTRARYRRFGGGGRGAHARCVRGGPSSLRRLVAARSGGAARSAGARRSRHLGRGYEHSDRAR